MKVDGSCHCGAIRYEAEIDPANVSVCHCTDCQVLTGTAFRLSVRAKEGSFVLLAGQPNTYMKTAESGRKRQHGFCGQCGAPLYSASIGERPIYGLRVGGLRQRAELPPKKQLWCRSALPWSADISEAEKFAREVP